MSSGLLIVDAGLRKYIFCTKADMLFTLCLPTRNEAANIQDALRRVVRALQELNIQHTTFNLPNAGIDWRIVVAINGTTDETLQRIEEFNIQHPTSNIGVLSRPEAGKGAAIRLAAQNSQADIFGFIDADLSADPDMIEPMIKKILAGEADIVIGSRLIDTRTTNRGFLRTLSSQFFNLMTRLILGLEVKDAQCGLKVMNAKARDILKTCREDGWFLDIEFLAKAVQDGLKIVEVPVPWVEFRYAGRKSRLSMLKDGLGAIKAMWRIKRKMSHYV